MAVAESAAPWAEVEVVLAAAAEVPVVPRAEAQALALEQGPAVRLALGPGPDSGVVALIGQCMPRATGSIDQGSSCVVVS